MRTFARLFLFIFIASAVAALAVGQQPSQPGGPGGKGKGGKGKQVVESTEQQLLADVRGTPAAFNVTIFAKPPDANYPTCLWPMPTGEVYIGSDPQGSLGKTPGMGRVLRAIDTKGTGKANQIDVWCQVDHPRGLFYDNGAMWICHPP